MGLKCLILSCLCTGKNKFRSAMKIEYSLSFLSKTIFFLNKCKIIVMLIEPVTLQDGLLITVQ